MATHDIDYFFVLKNGGKEYPIHVASRGSKLPDFVNDLKVNRKIQSAAAESGNQSSWDIDRFDIRFIVCNIKKQFETLPLEFEDYAYMVDSELYRSSFAYMASVGFYSFDTIHRDNEEDLYILVAIPKIGTMNDHLRQVMNGVTIEFENLPMQILMGDFNFLLTIIHTLEECNTVPNVEPYEVAA